MKDALRGRHPAVDPFGGPGAWTCIEEWMNIDLLAVAAWASVKPFPRYARVGYEVKVSRSDYKRELANPYKRAAAVAFCHEFYFAVPVDLLTPYEVGWDPPPGLDDVDPFAPLRCLGFGGWHCMDGRLRFPRYVHPNDRFGAVGHGDRERLRRAGGTCPVCYGTGTIGGSAAARAGAPKLWVPADVGLVLVHPNGRLVTAKKAPRRQPGRRVAGETSLLGPVVQARKADGIELRDEQLADLVRWVSFRPDPRHVAARERRAAS